MNYLKRIYVWLCRLPYCRGFGIQSPTDYAFVRYVINEHWQYYAYEQLNRLEGDWLEHKLGRLYFRLANWRQPAKMMEDEYAPYWKAGCHKVRLTKEMESIELVRVRMADITDSLLHRIYNKVDDQSVLVIEGISQNWGLWRQIQEDQHVRVSFDLYYCGIVFFDNKRQKQHYKVNF